MALNGGEIHASRSADGVIDWQQALAAPAQCAPPHHAIRHANPRRKTVSIQYRQRAAARLAGALSRPQFPPHAERRRGRTQSRFCRVQRQRRRRLSAVNSTVGPLVLQLGTRHQACCHAATDPHNEDGVLDLAKHSPPRCTRSSPAACDRSHPAGQQTAGLASDVRAAQSQSESQRQHRRASQRRKIRLDTGAATRRTGRCHTALRRSGQGQAGRAGYRTRRSGGTRRVARPGQSHPAQGGIPGETGWPV